MKHGESEADSVRISSTAIEVYLSSVDMAGLLQVSDSEVAKLARSAVLTRRPDPYDSRAYIYGAWENVRRYITHLRSRREKASLGFLEEKRKAQKTLRQRAQLEMAIKQGRLVDTEEFYNLMAPVFLKLREGFEKLLSIGVNEQVVNELVAILDPKPVKPGGNGQGPP